MLIFCDRYGRAALSHHLRHSRNCLCNNSDGSFPFTPRGYLCSIHESVNFGREFWDDTHNSLQVVSFPEMSQCSIQFLANSQIRRTKQLHSPFMESYGLWERFLGKSSRPLLLHDEICREIILTHTLSPLLGGTFSNPAERYPQWFDYPLLRDYPYFLPCFVAACISCCGAFFAYLYLEEVRIFPIYLHVTALNFMCRHIQTNEDTKITCN